MKNVIILDAVSDKNRGDAAMQIALIDLVKSSLSPQNISIVSWYGVNQKNAFQDEFAETLKSGEPILGGIRDTYFDFKKINNKFIKKILVGQSLVKSYFLLMIFILSSKLAKKMLGRDKLITLSQIESAELVIWNGRNFRGNGLLSELYTALCLCFHPLICIALKKRMVCIGASVWEYKYKLPEIIVSYCFSKCEYVTVREVKSLSIVRKSRIFEDRNVFLAPDLSFHYLTNLDHRICVRSKTVAVTIVDWARSNFKHQENYVTTMARTLEYLIGSGYNIIITPQVTTAGQSNRGALSKILGLLSAEKKDYVNVLSGEYTVHDLCKIYSSVDFLVATRMHSSIFAASVGTPSICVAYDSGSKWSIVEDLGIEVYDYDKITPDAFLNDLIRSLDNSNSKGKDIYLKYKMRCKEVPEHFNLRRLGLI